MLGAGFLLAGLSARLGWNAWSAYRAAPAAAEETTVAAAPDGRWVRLTDLQLRCDTRVVQRGSTFVLAADAAGAVPVAVHVLGDVACDAVGREGGFLPGRFTRVWLKETFDVVFPGAAEGPEVRLFTQTLAPEYQRRALLRTLPWAGFGALLTFVGARGLVRVVRRLPAGAGPPRRGGGAPGPG